ncbi:MAG: RNA polymerase sigma factor [Armatimonadota bacterium]
MPRFSLHKLRDRSLIQKVGAGDARAFGQLYDGYAPQVLGLLRRLCHSADEAEDLMQETFLAAPDALRGWRGESSLSTFLCAIAYRKWARLRRDDRPTLSLDDESQLPQTANTDDDPLAHLSRQELSRVLEAAIATLPWPLREAFVLVRIEDMAYRDAAHILEIPLGTLQSRLHRAHRLLRAALSESESAATTDSDNSIPSSPSDAARSVSNVSGATSLPLRAARVPQDKGNALHALD